MGMILRIASSRIVGQGDIVGRSGYFSLNLSANSVMRGRLDARRTLKSLVADLRIHNIAIPVSFPRFAIGNRRARSWQPYGPQPATGEPAITKRGFGTYTKTKRIREYPV